MTLSAGTHERPVRRRRNGNAEAQIQASVVEWIRVAAPQVLVFHVPNGGLRSKSEAARLKWQGVVAGIPDLCVVAPKGKCYFLEIKIPRGRFSDDQDKIMATLWHMQVPVSICRSIDEARSLFKRWKISTREVAQ